MPLIFQFLCNAVRALRFANALAFLTSTANGRAQIDHPTQAVAEKVIEHDTA
jgi:hypothetical protein